MTGSYDVKVQYNDLQYKFTINRNITIIRGESASGKSKLLEAIVNINSLQLNMSKAFIDSEIPCVVIEPIRIQYEIEGLTRKQQQLKHIRESVHLLTNTIIFIDEDCDVLQHSEMCNIIEGSSNYFVFITRSSLNCLPYSIKEIYSLTTSGKYCIFVPVYINTEIILEEPKLFDLHFDYLITEDSNSGFYFFEFVQDLFSSHISVKPANGKDSLGFILQQHKLKTESIVFFVDGSAFGSSMESFLRLSKNYNTRLVHFESFEHMLMLANTKGLRNIYRQASNLSDFVRSEDHLSWERYCTHLMSVTCKDSMDFYYSKSFLPKYFKQKEVVQTICNFLGYEGDVESLFREDKTQESTNTNIDIKMDFFGKED